MKNETFTNDAWYADYVAVQRSLTDERAWEGNVIKLRKSSKEIRSMIERSKHILIGFIRKKV